MLPIRWPASTTGATPTRARATTTCGGALLLAKPQEAQAAGGHAQRDDARRCAARRRRQRDSDRGARPSVEPEAAPPAEQSPDGRDAAGDHGHRSGGDAERSRATAAIKVRARLQRAGGVRAEQSSPTRRATPQVPVKLPDNLTRYRVMAVAVAGEQAVRLRARRRSPRGCR